MSPETAGADNREQVLPFFLVADESASMEGPPIEAINDELPELHSAVASDPIVAEKVRFSLITFAGDAQVLLGLSDLSELTSMPGLTVRDGGTNYRAAFELVHREIDAEVARLHCDGFQVLRPAVFFLSDGCPNGPDWTAAHRALTTEGNPRRPNVLAFGIGSADAQVIRRVATLAAFMAQDGTSPAGALHEFAVALTKSVMASGSALASGTGSLTVANPSGFVSLPVDPVPVVQ
jgi:uncharacterized protein YegL